MLWSNGSNSDVAETLASALELRALSHWVVVTRRKFASVSTGNAVAGAVDVRATRIVTRHVLKSSMFAEGRLGGDFLVAHNENNCLWSTETKDEGPNRVIQTKVSSKNGDVI